jgi:putative transposase
MSKEDTQLKGTRYSEEQIIKILREAEAGMSAAEVCRKHGVSEWSFYRWRQKYGGMNISEAKRLKSVEEENRRLKRIVARQALDIDLLNELNSKNW